MNVEIVEGDLLNQDVDAIVNPWNRNIIPWWLLWPHGVSGAIKKRGGYAPFQQLPKRPIPLGDAVLTGAGRLPFKAIIHVAGINGWWRANEFSIRASVRNAIQLAQAEGFRSLAFPIIGAGAGSFSEEKALVFILDELKNLQGDLQIKVVRFRPPTSTK
ncbi:O-acetyl-ADP-ribose deacetylase [Abditibacteriota bacterium]|nr:O-acetyl-ADP-ribose deacetylase [Abditibacteriota bacterium]